MNGSDSTSAKVSDYQKLSFYVKDDNLFRREMRYRFKKPTSKKSSRENQYVMIRGRADFESAVLRCKNETEALFNKLNEPMEVGETCSELLGHIFDLCPKKCTGKVCVDLIRSGGVTVSKSNKDRLGYMCLKELSQNGIVKRLPDYRFGLYGKYYDLLMLNFPIEKMGRIETIPEQ